MVPAVIHDGRVGSVSPGRPMHVTRQFAIAAMTIATLLLVWPVLVKVYRRVPYVVTLGPGWLSAIGMMIVLHFLAVWALYRVVLRTSSWFDIATSQLAANAASHVAPAGSAVGAGMQLRMWTVAGYPAGQATTALGVTTMLGTIAGYVLLPLVVLLASVLGLGLRPRLAAAMWSGAAVLTALLIVAVVLFQREAPWRRIARVVTAVQRHLRRPGDADALGSRLIQERNLMQGALRQRAGLVVLLVLVQPMADFIALYLALLAAGAHVNLAGALAALIVANVAGLIPLTPGGFGFVEAGLLGALAFAGAATPDAQLAVVTYRLAATWVPSLAGVLAFAWFQYRHSQPRCDRTPNNIQEENP
jgi:uncharacterized protein (TIRG00374 family)